MNFIKKIFPILLILIFSFFAFKPFLSNGFFPIHDDTQVARVYEMTNALKDGMFPVRWSKDLGYGFGYPLFNFYDPLPYYIAGSISLLGFDSLFSTKLMVILAIILSGFSMYLLSKEFFGKKGALFSSALYILAPFHAVEIYVRGDFAENFAYALIPLLFYGLFKIYKDYKWKYIVITAIGYAGIILSHNLTAMMVSPFALLFIIYIVLRERKNKLNYLVKSVGALIIGIMFSSFYVIPAIFEMGFTDVLSQIGGGANFRDHFVCASQLWISQWGYGGSTKDCIDGFSFMIGKYHILLSVSIFALSVFFLYSKKLSKQFAKEKEKLKIIIFLFFGFLTSIFLLLDISKPLWELIKPMEFFQYPWRFLLMVSFFASFMAGALFLFLERLIKDKNVNYLLTVSIFVFIVFVSLKFFVPQIVLVKNAGDYTNSYALNWETSKISDEYMPKGFKVPKERYEIPDVSNLKTNELSINILERKTQYIKLSLDVLKKGDYILPVAYFPTWKAKIDGKEVKLTQNSKGMIVNFPKGKHILELSFVQTPIENLGNIVSIAGILVLVAGIIRLRPKI